MGLDSVELVLAVEEEFGIGIPDEDAANLTTPRILADYVVSRLGNLGSNDSRCLSQASFYRLRSVLVNQFLASRNDVRPSSRIDAFLTANVRRQWSDLMTAIEASHAPSLRCRPTIYYPLTLGIPIASVALLLFEAFPPWVPLTSGLVLWLLTNMVASQVADVLPLGMVTVGDLVPYVRAPYREAWSPSYVLQRVIQITAVQLGIPIEKIEPDHHFVKDLGLDS
ncbi:MAG TPA: hypothetical protein VF816_03695 [Rhodocyclaceae bacterium]